MVALILAKYCGPTSLVSCDTASGELWNPELQPLKLYFLDFYYGLLLLEYTSVNSIQFKSHNKFFQKMLILEQ